VCATGSRELNVSVDSLIQEFGALTLNSRRLGRVLIGPHLSWIACVSSSRLV